MQINKIQIPFCIHHITNIFLLVLLLFLSGCTTTKQTDPIAYLIETKLAKEEVDEDVDEVQNISGVLSEQLKVWKGTPYRYGGFSRKGIDCSGFVQITYRDKFQTILPRTTSAQAKTGIKVAKNDLKAGDIVLFRTGRGGNGLHSGIYDKDGEFIHASTKNGVMRSSLYDDYWKRSYWQSRRVLN